MLMNFEHGPLIEDLRNHPTDMVKRLHNLLINGANVVSDPKRKGFYELEADSMVYYIYVSPVTGTIFFLATWEKTGASALQMQNDYFPGRPAICRGRACGAI